MEIIYVYMTLNIITNMAYVGMSNLKNKFYLGSGHLLKESINKYRRHNFNMTILGKFNSRSEAHYWEGYYINYLNTLTPDGYNTRSDGGKVGYSTKEHPMYSKKHNEKTKDKIRNSLTGLVISDVTRKKLSMYNNRKGTKHTDEAKKKISLAQIGNTKRLGKLHTDETKKKISNTLKGQIPWNKGIPISEEQKAKFRATLARKQLNETQ